MSKHFRSIEIVRSTNKALSSMSRVSADAVLAVLSQHFIDVRITIVNCASDLEQIAIRRPDLVFLTVKYVPVLDGQDRNDLDIIWVADFLDKHGIAYTGSNQKAHILELNKPLAKQRAIDAGLNTSAFHLVDKDYSHLPKESSLKYPLFIKPSNRGGGLGVGADSIVYTREEAATKMSAISENHQADSLVEEYLTGREFSVAILKRENEDTHRVMPIEIVVESVSGSTVMGAEVKHENNEVILTVEDQEIHKNVCALALDIFKALGARDYGRIDIRLNKDGVAQFLEANLIPSLIAGYGNFPKACALNENIQYEDMILGIVNLGLTRSGSPLVKTKGIARAF